MAKRQGPVVSGIADQFCSCCLDQTPHLLRQLWWVELPSGFTLLYCPFCDGMADADQEGWDLP